MTPTTETKIYEVYEFGGADTKHAGFNTRASTFYATSAREALEAFNPPGPILFDEHPDHAWSCYSDHVAQPKLEHYLAAQLAVKE